MNDVLADVLMWCGVAMVLALSVLLWALVVVVVRKLWLELWRNDG